tara:strand:+ start:1355 stop:1831 length:477 start_codon:yes stop_codon:yes gene_type:complete
MSLSVTAPAKASKATRKTRVTAITLQYPAVPSNQQWNSWIDSLPEEVWQWSCESEPALEKEYGFIPLFLDPNNPQHIPKEVSSQYKTQAKELTPEQLKNLFSLGNPTIPAAHEGLAFKYIYHYIQSLALDNDEDPELGHDNIYGEIFRRIHCFINHHQ